MSMVDDETVTLRAVEIKMRELGYPRSVEQVWSQLDALHDLLSFASAAYSRGLVITRDSTLTSETYTVTVVGTPDDVQVESLQLSGPLVVVLTNLPTAGEVGVGASLAVGTLLGLVHVVNKINDMRVRHSQANAEIARSDYIRETYKVMRSDLRGGVRRQLAERSPSSEWTDVPDDLEGAVDSLADRGSRALDEVAEVTPI
jgi:hypothetical protein